MPLAAETVGGALETFVGQQIDDTAKNYEVDNGEDTEEARDGYRETAESRAALPITAYNTATEQSHDQPADAPARQRHDRPGPGLPAACRHLVRRGADPTDRVTAAAHSRPLLPRGRDGGQRVGDHRRHPAAHGHGPVPCAVGSVRGRRHRRGTTAATRSGVLTVEFCTHNGQTYAWRAQYFPEQDVLPLPERTTLPAPLREARPWIGHLAAWTDGWPARSVIRLRPCRRERKIGRSPCPVSSLGEHP